MSIFSSGSGDVFRTQADTRFNSFAEPMNSVNMNPGNWGVDPNYLTPSYLSPFRPQYQGPTGNSYAGYRPSWGTSMNQVFNPFAPGGENYGGNYHQQTSPYYDNIYQKPVDEIASGVQNLVVPGAATWAAYKYWGQGAANVGRAAGGGLAAGLFRGANTQFAARMVQGASWTGGLVGGLALPTLAASAVVGAVDSAVFDPYVAQRRMGAGLRENFAGVTFGGNTGDQFTGGGLSRKTAAGIANRVSQAGARDMTFTQNETSMLTDYATRAGMLDNANPAQMAGRFEGILKQVKLVMAIANTSDFKETIEIMSKMQMSGVNHTQMAGVMGQLGASASAGGLSMQKVYNTVGTQGQYLFGAAGLTPYVGQLTAGANMAAMSTAFRSGLISPALMARMGGMEGATQSATGAQIASYKTPYASMQASNAYFGGGETGNVVSNIAQFGGRMAGNPLENIGRHFMSANALASRHIQDRGLMGEQDMIYQLAKQLPNGLKANGKVDAGVAYMIMTNMQGLTPEMAQAKLAQISAHGDASTVGTMLAGNQRGSIDSLLKYQQQEGLNKGILTPLYNYAKRGFMAVQRAGASAVGETLEQVGDFTDSLQNFMTEGLFRTSAGENKFQEFTGSMNTPVGQANVHNLGALTSRGDPTARGMAYYENKTQIEDLKKINTLAKNRDPNAVVYLDAKASPKDRQNALWNLAKEGKVRGDYTSKEAAANLTDIVSKMGITALDPEKGGGSTRDLLVANLGKVLKGGTIDQSIEHINLMDKVGTMLDDGKAVPEADLKRIAELNGVEVGSLDNQTLQKMVNKTAETVGENRLSHLVGLGKVNDADGLEAALKKERGGMALAPKIESSGDSQALRAQIKTQAGYAKNRNQIMQLYKEGKIDTGAAMGAINALDSGAAVGKFGTAVDKFGEYVERMSPKETPTVGDKVVDWFRGGNVRTQR